jgi:hypothetical protein
MTKSRARNTSRQGKIACAFRMERNHSHQHDNGNVINRTSMDIDLLDTNLLDEIYVSIRIIGIKSLG